MKTISPDFAPALGGEAAERMLEAMHDCLSQAISWEGILFRSAGMRFASERDLLSGAGSHRFGGRFNLPGIYVTYASTDYMTASAEINFYGTHCGWESRLPRLDTGVKVRFARLLDLRENSACRRILGLTEAELLAEWEPLMASKREAVTQMVGRLARDAGFEGILAPSARCVGLNLDFFPDRLLPESFVQIMNPQDLPPRRGG